MPVPHLTNVPDVFWPALGGGIGGGIAIIIIEVFRWYVNRPLVQCKLFPGFILDNNSKTSTRFLFFEAVNPHHTPVTLSNFGLLYKKKEWGKIVVNPDVPFPYELGGGKSLSQRAIPQQLLKVMKKSGRVPQDLKWVFFQASSGKLYRDKIPNWVIKKLEGEFSKLSKNESQIT